MGYWSRVVSTSIFVVLLIGAQLVRALDLVRTNPAGAWAQLLLVPLIPVLIFGLIALIGWARTRFARVRRRLLEARLSGRWMADVRMNVSDAESSVGFKGVVDWPMPRSFALWANDGQLEVWAAAENSSPMIVMLRSQVDSIEVSPVADTERGSGDFFIQLREDSEPLSLALGGPLFGFFPASPGQVAKLVDRLYAEVDATA